MTEEKHINDMIECESSEWFRSQSFSEKTEKLMSKLLHYAARNDMISRADGGMYQVAEEFINIIAKYRESVRADLAISHKEKI